MNRIKEIKILSEKCFKPTWHRKMFFLIFCYNLASYQNKKVAIIELRNENEYNVISYSQLRKLKISLVKKTQTTEIYYFPHYT